MSNPRLQVDIGVNLKEFNQGMKDLTNRLKSVGDRLTSVGTTLSTRLTLPLVTAGGAAIKLASDFEESLNKVNVAFGDSAIQVRKFSKTTLETFGIAQGTALDMAALFGDMGTAMGLPTDAAARMSTQLVGLSGDLASFKNQRIDVVQTALAGIFTGETESLKRLGIVMTQANLQTFALSQGIQKNIQDMTQAEMVNLRFAYVMQNTTNAQGDFARTSGGAANQMRIFQESVKEVGQQLGNIMLPIFTDMVKRVNEVMKAFAGLDTDTKAKLISFGAVLAGLGPVLVSLGLAMKGLAVAFGVLTSPITLIIAGLTAISLTIKYVIDNWTGLKERFTDWSWWKNTILDMAAFFNRYAPGLLGGQGEAIALGLEAMKTNLEGTFPAIETFGQFMGRTGDQVKGLIADLFNLDFRVRNFGKGIESAPIKVKESIDQLVPAIARVSAPFNSAREAALSTSLDIKSALLDLTATANYFAEGFAAGLANIVVEGGKLKDMMKSIGRELLKSGLQKIFMAFLTGGIGTGAGFFGAGGGLLGSILPGIFGASAVSAGAMTPALTGQNITVGGQFVLKGTDLAASIIRTNKSTLR